MNILKGLSRKKSADRADFGLNWVLASIQDKQYPWSAILATLSEVVAHTVVSAIKQHIHPHPPETLTQLIAYGGMAYNQTIMQRIKYQLNKQGSFEFIKMQTLGYDPDFFESLLLAYLGYCADNKIAINLSYCARESVQEKEAFAIPGSIAFPALDIA